MPKSATMFKKIMLLSIALFISGYSFSQSHAGDLMLNSTNIDKQDSLPYAMLYFYRAFIPKMNAPLKKVPIYVNDSLVYNLKANTLIPVRVFKEGKFKIAVDKNGESEIVAKIKLGGEYFFRCEIEKGLWFGKPAIEAVTAKIGKEESGLVKIE